MADKQIVSADRRDFVRLAIAGSVGLGFASLPLAVLGQVSGTQPLKIATIGSGRIGSTLGALWIKA